MALRPRLLDWPASSTFKPHQVAATCRPRTEARLRRLDDARGIDNSRPVTEEPISKLLGVAEATLWILNTGAQWHMLPQCYPNYKTVHRRFQTWCQSEVLRRVLTDIANELRARGVLDEEESFIDATFAMAKGGGADIGPTKRGKGLKIMAIVDRHGLPLSVSTHAANHHEVRLVQLCFDFYMIEAKPENLIGDRAYDSDPLDEELRRDGIEMIAPHRSNRSRPATQDGRRLRRYARRWVVERFFAWVQWQRRILVRWEYYPQNFLGFVQLACLLILFKRF